MRKSPKISLEVVERAVRLVFEAKGQYSSQWAAVEFIAGTVGCTAETLRRWVRQAERDQGPRDGPTTADQQRGRDLEREVCELRKAKDILKLASAVRPGGVRPPPQVVSAFVEQHRQRFGVEPICNALQVAPSAIWKRQA